MIKMIGSGIPSSHNSNPRPMFFAYRSPAGGAAAYLLEHLTSLYTL
jgi:hypothetical protein